MSAPAGPMTLLAVDGDTARDVDAQRQRLPADATHLIVSVGGNDALLKDAYTECERILFFTDLDESALMAQERTNNDVITHFISSQKVHEEMTVAVSRAWSFPFQYSMVRSQTVDTYSSCQKLPPTREEEEEAQVTKAIEMYLDR